MPAEARHGEAAPKRAAGGGLSRQAMQLLQRAAALYDRPDLAGAEGACRQLLQRHPDQADALHILGLIAWRRGDRGRAVEDIRKAIAGDPGKPQPHNSLGVLLKEAGDVGGAEAAFRRALELRPTYLEALTNLGNVCCETGRLAEAEALHRRAVELAPGYADARNNLATALARRERWDEALEECRVAVSLQPGRAEFHLNLGKTLSALNAWQEAAAAFQRAAERAPANADAQAGLGVALYYLYQSERAAAAHRRATELAPDRADIWTNLAAAQVDLGDLDAAMVSCRRALDIDPNAADAYSCMSLILRRKGLVAEAFAAQETAIRLRPEDPKGYHNIGNSLQLLGRLDDALAAYAKATALNPDYREARYSAGMLHLLHGDLERGWRGYEQGLHAKRPRARAPYRHVPYWDGSSVAGKTIAITTEQGVGDQIMFASMLPDLVAQGATCIVHLDPRLTPLLRRSIDGLVLPSQEEAAQASTDSPAADYQSPIGSLGRWLRPDLASFPDRAGYLKADAQQVDRLRRRYRARFGARPLAGISWRGGTGEAVQVRSIPLSLWAPILTQPQIGFINLQYGDCRAELATVRAQLGVDIFHDDEIDPLASLDDFAAQTAAMDLIVSIDNSTVHMAGALNAPVWVLLPRVPDWRWMLDRTGSPWYRSVRLFRQAELGVWPPVIAAVAEELAHWVESRADEIEGAC